MSCEQAQTLGTRAVLDLAYDGRGNASSREHGLFQWSGTFAHRALCLSLLYHNAQCLSPAQTRAIAPADSPCLAVAFLGAFQRILWKHGGDKSLGCERVCPTHIRDLVFPSRRRSYLPTVPTVPPSTSRRQLVGGQLHKHTVNRPRCVSLLSPVPPSRPPLWPWPRRCPRTSSGLLVSPSCKSIDGNAR